MISAFDSSRLRPFCIRHTCIPSTQCLIASVVLVPAIVYISLSHLHHSLFPSSPSYTLTPNNILTNILCPPTQIGPPRKNGSTSFRLVCILAARRLLASTSSNLPCLNASTSSLLTNPVSASAAKVHRLKTCSQLIQSCVCVFAIFVISWRV